MSIFNALNASIYSTLTGGTGLTSLLSGTGAVYYQNAPAGGTLPYVVFSLQAGGPLNYTTSDMRDEIYYVRAYANSAALAGSIDKQVCDLLHHKTLTVSGYSNYWTARETDIAIVEQTPANEQIYAAGGMYRIRLDD